MKYVRNKRIAEELNKNREEEEEGNNETKLSISYQPYSVCHFNKQQWHIRERKRN